MWERATHDEAVGEIAFPMAARQGVKARTVRQRLWLLRVQLPASKGKSVAVTCLVAREFDAPTGVAPIEWRLLTIRTASTLDEATESIEWYRARWEIEILFNVLKNGCQVEELQLGTIERLERALALFLVVAWRVTYLMRLGRSCPDLDARLFFDPGRIQDGPASPRCMVLNDCLRCAQFDHTPLTQRTERIIGDVGDVHSQMQTLTHLQYALRVFEHPADRQIEAIQFGAVSLP
ncbi:transposase [Paraburkholderia sp. NMBU_R16]|uniref:transposase n=1 Tax=Paraburkholderia sp. NMBU_R16 TaxID=2698676 RepID=UPI00156515FB|nr:transposase [Paraburkholderia sp. NMBU_R16]NRO99609.1 transposase [Paraburkholderia sp. NMBU_R16]